MSVSRGDETQKVTQLDRSPLTSHQTTPPPTMSSFFGLSKTRTFKPKRNIPEGTKQYQLKRYAEATLGSGNLRAAVLLPEGEDLNEWLAVNTVDFFNHLNMLYGTITEFCTPIACPTMSAGPRYEYHWQDANNPIYKRPTKLSAPDYVDCLMGWTQSMLDDEAIFPSKVGQYTRGADGMAELN